MITLTGCDNENDNKKASDEFGIDLSDAIISKSIDTHGGFLGDGITYMEFKFDHAVEVEKELKENKSWMPLPLSDNLQVVVYGDDDNKSLVQSFDKEVPAIPEVSEGYYYFKDRHSESTDSSDDSKIFKRNSFNFDIFIYDTAEHIMYFFQLDT
jgi:hypothetical protein